MSSAGYMILAGKTLEKTISFRLINNTSEHEGRYVTGARNRLCKPQEIKGCFASVIGVVTQFGFNAE